MPVTMTAREQDDSGRARLREIIAEKSFREGEFTLSSGKKSDVFFNLKPTMLDPEGLNLIADQVLEKLQDRDAEFIGGLLMGAAPILLSVVQKSYFTPRSLRGFWVRKERKAHGMQQMIDGDPGAGDRIIVVEDVTTTGESVLKAVDAMRNRGCDIVGVLTIVDRCEGAVERVKESGHDLISIFDRYDFTSREPREVS
jgi:orotate phosphoribosyltransferase